MLNEEVNALRRLSLTEHGEETTRKHALNSEDPERFFGYRDAATNNLVALGKEAAHLKIALRIYEKHKNEIINLCPKCQKLARTPKAKQCRHCGHDWHGH
jgi:hypothetical protein